MILRLLSIVFYYLGFGILYALYREHIIHQCFKNEDFERLVRIVNKPIHKELTSFFEWIILTKIRIDEALDDEL